MFKYLPIDIINSIFNNLPVQNIFILKLLDKDIYNHLNNNCYWTSRFNDIYSSLLNPINNNITISKHIAELYKCLKLVKNIYDINNNIYTKDYMNRKYYYLNINNTNSNYSTMCNILENYLKFGKNITIDGRVTVVPLSFPLFILELRGLIMKIEDNLKIVNKAKFQRITFLGFINNLPIFNALDSNMKYACIFTVEHATIRKFTMCSRMHIPIIRQNKLYFDFDNKLYKYNISKNYVKFICLTVLKSNESMILSWNLWYNTYLLFYSLSDDEFITTYKLYDTCSKKFIFEFSQKHDSTLCQSGNELIIINNNLYYVVIKQKIDRVQYILKCINILNGTKSNLATLIDLDTSKFGECNPIILTNRQDNYIIITIMHNMFKSKALYVVANCCYSIELNYYIIDTSMADKKMRLTDNNNIAFNIVGKNGSFVLLHSDISNKIRFTIID